MKRLIATTLTLAALAASAEDSSEAQSAYLMVYFTDPTHDLFMATSDDGYSFTAVNGNRPVIGGDTIAE